MSLVTLLEQAGLTGRGGARFPTSIKLQSALDAGADLIVNACDGEIGVHKDALVVAEHLDALQHGAGLLARRTRWAAHRGSETERRLHDAGLRVLSVPSRYVASEESALVNLLHGGRARPITRLAPISTGGRDAQGRRLRPTLVLNAETVWRVSQIERHGAAWFRGFGTAEEPGPRLVTMGGNVERPGVYDAEAGIPLRDLLDAAGALDVQGVGISGMSGGWLGGHDAWTATWSDAGLAPYGVPTGTGAVHVLDRRSCPIDHLSRIATFAAGESAGQCGPCMFGVPAVAEQLERLADGALPPEEMLDLHHRLGMLPGRGACRFPDGVSRFVASGLRTFTAEVEAHLAGRCALTKEWAGAAR
ncbi:NADH-ubiquinone oxidoreductase-F iron-sulfur binding region domain-containing protein [Allobranchiibius sp. GilTou73]|uniref:NADH-ubiquinone oxidoreductase-F iron-sulfur binding region domain-containing protein n=1 Tax=Allobranchiibius sp. GilTou73 TaxID=2904523 RepID=UPI001F35F336|nr:NADH-ubiquinone oxidoreductase-F iron-sulfur binding region domain-containing protein [Allobranchiibius sp. GilTou73]UIJ35500.1 SLBB domain-containing protein [Allobranchiibius sp. GilTou73]